MLFIFCSEPFYPKKPDYAYQSEAEIVAQKGFEFELFSFEDLTGKNPSQALERIKTRDRQESAIYRGWMLKPAFYENLFKELQNRNITLINSPEEYRHCHYLPESYEVIKDHTPRSIFFPIEDQLDFEELLGKLSIFGEKPLILKDYVKSRKHEWEEACFIPNAANRNDVEKIVRRFIELQGTDLNKGLVFREFVEFQKLTNHSKSGMPLTKEFRLFFLNNKLIYTSEYWEEGIYQPEDFPKDLFLNVAAQVQSNFFTMDVAQKTDGEWLIVELGDGQVAGLPDKTDISGFYDCFGLIPYELWRQDDHGHKFLIETFPCQTDALAALKEFEKLRHKQTYWIEKQKI